MQYASKYYDPDKAHEYYEKTKVLKGYENRYGGSRGNGTSAASGGYTGNNSSSSSSSGITDGNGKALTETQAHNMQIKEQIASLKQRLNGMSKEVRKANREAINDQIQALREQTRGGSTSGFNQKGKEAAVYIKSQMEKERDEVIEKANKDADDAMLDRVKKLQTDIKTMRESGNSFSNKEFVSRINAMLGETKKIKQKSKEKYTQDYAQKYKYEIDKLRGDQSMYTYYDKKAERKQREAERAAEKAERKKSKKDTSSNRNTSSVGNKIYSGLSNRIISSGSSNRNTSSEGSKIYSGLSNRIINRNTSNGGNKIFSGSSNRNTSSVGNKIFSGRY